MGGEVDGDVSHEDGERRAAGLDYREGSPAASRSEEEDRELVSRRRGRTNAAASGPQSQRPMPSHKMPTRSPVLEPGRSFWGD